MKDQIIDVRDEICFLHWCGHFSCTPDALRAAMKATGSDQVGVVAMYLATCARHLRGDPRKPSVRLRSSGLEYCMGLEDQ